MNGFQFLGTSGQNIKDMMLNSVSEPADSGIDLLDDDQKMLDEEEGQQEMSEKEEGDLCLAKLK